MKLHYKILWIDDQIEDYIEMGIKSEFESYLDSLGFTTLVETFENGSKAEQSIKSVNYDLILSDYNIEGENEQGDVLIQKIRDGGVFTEVLFYSAQSNFEDIAKSLYRDRVSFFSLINDEGMREFRERVYRLINLTVAKLQELNNIRGLVMAETSELDNSVVDILSTFFSAESDEATKLRGYIIKSIQESTKGNQDKAAKLDDLENVVILKERIFDADKKARAIGKLLKFKKLDEQEPFINFYDNYKADVIDKRNDLAHAKSDTIDGVEYLILSRKDGEHPEKFDQEKCIEIRKNLKKHTEILKKIRELTLPIPN
nr:response regulator [Pedobacter sp. ASV2]